MTKPTIQILMVEDSKTDALLLEEILGRDGLNSFEFTPSERLKSGLEMLHKQKFDLVLLDLGLPDSQGLETFEKLHSEFPDMPVVVLSGLVDERLALEAVQAGAQDYLVKRALELGDCAARHPLCHRAPAIASCSARE